MRRSGREELAPSEIMDTSVAVTSAQKDAAMSVIFRRVKNADEALEIISALGLNS